MEATMIKFNAFGVSVYFVEGRGMPFLLEELARMQY